MAAPAAATRKGLFRLGCQARGHASPRRSSLRVRPRDRPGHANSAPLPALLAARRSPKKPCTIPSGWLSQSSPQGMALKAGASAAGAALLRGPSALGSRLLLGGSFAPSHARGVASRGPPGEAAAVTSASELLLASDRGGLTVPTSASHNGGKSRPPTALPATWVELEREGRRERAAQSRRGAGGRGAAAILEAGRDGGRGGWQSRGRHLGDGQRKETVLCVGVTL